MSALPPKADIGTQSWNVCFVPKADMEVHSSTSSAIALGCSDYASASTMRMSRSAALPNTFNAA
jgi:hypothetical protein